MTDTPNRTPSTEQVAGQLPLVDVDDRATQLRAQLDALDTQRLSAKLEALDEVATRSRATRAAGDALDQAVNAARAYGATWREIAEHVDLTVSATWERWAHRG